MPSPSVADRVAVAGHVAREVPSGPGGFHQGIKAGGDAIHLGDCHRISGEKLGDVHVFFGDITNKNGKSWRRKKMDGESYGRYICSG